MFVFIDILAKILQTTNSPIFNFCALNFGSVSTFETVISWNEGKRKKCLG